ncbi:hypothetical protein GOA73_08355 [Sinorhizobium meliloti]|nr:hypothetical protein [Sinorhizobium meliloti]
MAVSRGENPVIILVHGIRTRAFWQGMVRSILTQELGATVVPIKYGYFDLLRFLCPFGFCRRGPIDRVHKAIREVVDDYDDQRPIIIAHSYGTYAVAKVLEEYSDVYLCRLILCGSVVPNNFRWDRTKKQILTQPIRMGIINECGTRDIWPVAANSITLGYGNSGTYGFGSSSVTDRSHRMSHSGYFDESFVRAFWVPFLRDGTIVPSPVDKLGEGPPWWLSIFGWPLTASFFAMLAFIGLVIWFPACPDPLSAPYLWQNNSERSVYFGEEYRQFTEVKPWLEGINFCKAKAAEFARTENKGVAYGGSFVELAEPGNFESETVGITCLFRDLTGPPFEQGKTASCMKFRVRGLIERYLFPRSFGAPDGVF